MLKNQQEVQSISKSDTLQVHSIFYTIQGEGIFAGVPAVFIRLAGCNLQCPFCDTDYTSNFIEESPFQIAKLAGQELRKNTTRLSAATSSAPLAVITGGEPLRQRAVWKLISDLLYVGFKVQIETNGTIRPDYKLQEMLENRNVFVVCSPKTTKINPMLERYIDAYKYVVKADCYDLRDGLPLQALGHTATPKVARPDLQYFGRPVFIQPLDEQDSKLNEANLKAAISISKQFCYTLQLQIHKIIGVD